MKQSIVEAKMKIRRALETPLFAAMQDAGLDGCIQHGGLAFDRAEKSNWMAMEINWGDVRVLEIGPTPMLEGNGGITLVLYSPLAQGDDGNDALAGIAASAYPYASTPTFDDVTVLVDKMESGAYGVEGAWRTGLITIDWTVYRGR